MGAVLTENGRILGTGDYETSKGHGARVQTADLQGNVMLPGFIDPHSHFTACASQTMDKVDLSHAGDFGEIIQCIQVFIKEQKIPEGQWIQAAGYDHNSLREGTHPEGRCLTKQVPGTR